MDQINNVHTPITPAALGQLLGDLVKRAAFEESHREILERAAEMLRAIPEHVHLVGIPGASYQGIPQKVRAAFTDLDQAREWARDYNATVAWEPETKTVLLEEIPLVCPGARVPEPGVDA